MATTTILYPRAAEPARVDGQPLRWVTPEAAAGAPNGTFAVDADASRGGRQQLRLLGYEPQATILAATGGVAPYAVDRLQVQVTFAVDDSFTNYSDVRVLLANASGVFAGAPLYIGDAGRGVGAVTAAVNFPDRGDYGATPIGWRDLADLQVLVEITRSGAAGPDTFRIDAVGLLVTYTAVAPQGFAAPVPASSTSVGLRVYDRLGNRLGTLHWSSLSRTIVRNALGSLTATVPRSLVGGGLLDDGERWLRVVEDGVEAPDWYTLDDDGDDDADEGGPARPVSIGASSAAQMLDWGGVYSWEYDPRNGNLLGLDPTYGFADATPGKIMATFIDAAKARGVFPQLTYSFTAEHDSAGRAWPLSYARTYDVGTSLLTVLTAMGDDAWVDWEMVGFRLDVYVPDTALAVDRPDVVLRLGQAVTSGPRKRSRKGARSVLLANGAEGATVEVKDPAAVALWGRREGYEGRNGVTDVGTLTATTTTSLQRMTTASESITLELAPEAVPDLYLPRPGGYIRYDQRRLSATQLEPMRLQSIAWDYGDDGKVSVELNDLWVDRDVKRGRQIDALLGGSSANERVPVQPAGDDRIPPGAVQGLALVSSAYVDPTTGQLNAQMTATWQEVKVDADGTAIDDLLGYDIEWRQPDVYVGATSRRTRVVTVEQWSPVVPNTSIDVRIRAVDRYENPGVWSAWKSITTGRDETGPARPSKPTVGNYLGLLRVAWDGLFDDGSARAADMATLEVHVSSVPGFEPDVRPIADGGTLAGTMYAAGPVYLPATYAEMRYAKLVAVDTSGNRSPASVEGSGSTDQIVSDDLFTNAVDSRVLKDLAVQTAHIQELDLNNARVSTISVAKLTAGVINAEVTISGRIATALTGRRAEMNALGFQAWDAAGTQTINLDGTNNLLTGRFSTALTGRRIEMGLLTSQIGRIEFYSEGGVISELATLSVGAEIIQMRARDESTNYWWRAVQVASDEKIRLSSGQVEVRFGGEGTPDQTPVKEFVVGRVLTGRVVNSAHTNRERYLINSTSTMTSIEEKGFWAIYRYRNAANDRVNVYQITDDGVHYFYPGVEGASRGYIGMFPGDSVNSPRLGLFNGENWGLAWKMQRRQQDNIMLMQCVFWDRAETPTDLGSFAYAQAKDWDVMSDAAFKSEIVDVEPDQATSIAAGFLNARPRTYTMAGADGTPEPIRHVGLIAQEAPGFMVRGQDGEKSISLYKYITGVLITLQHVNERLAKAEAELAKGRTK